MSTTPGLRCDLGRILADRHMTQRAVAHHLGVGTQVVSDWCCGRSTVAGPHLLSALRLARMLRMPVEDIWQLEDGRTAMTWASPLAVQEDPP